MPSAITLIGAAGEHFVMRQFFRRGLIAALAPVNVPNADLIVTFNIGNKLCAIQFKARVDKGSEGGWHMSEKHEDIVPENLLFAFPDFRSSLVDRPNCFIVPSEGVAAAVMCHTLFGSQHL